MKKILMACCITLVSACSSIKPVGAKKYEVSCAGDDDSECQTKAWGYCKGPFKTFNDDYTGLTMASSNTPGNMQITRGYKIVFQCEEHAQ